MNKQVFWALIEQAKNHDTNIMLDNLNQALCKLPSYDIISFRGYLSAYMMNIDECIWKDMACKVINGYVSDDSGLYFSLWLLAQGEQVLHGALTDPDSLAELEYIPFGCAEFEMLMSLGMDEDVNFTMLDQLILQYTQEVGVSISYKDNSKYGNYDSFEQAMDDIPNVLPKLIFRANQHSAVW